MDVFDALLVLAFAYFVVSTAITFGLAHAALAAGIAMFAFGVGAYQGMTREHRA